MDIFNRLSGLFAKVKTLPVGMYHLQSPMEDEKQFRLHLRLQRNGSGILILNASTVLQLNHTAAEYAYHLIKGSEPLEAAKSISSRYRITKIQALQDYNEFVSKMKELIHNEDLDPVSVLGLGHAQAYSGDLSAPLRLDCALTYRLPVETVPSFAPTKRVTRELTTSEWQTILDKAWAVGIPHIVFTGGEPTLRDDLEKLIAHSEKNGQVTGLLTDGNIFREISFLENLLKVGLDHLMIILPVNSEPNWEALKNAIQADIYLATHLTISPENFSIAKVLIDKLRAAGVENLSLSCSEQALKEQTLHLRDHAINNNLHMVSDLPVPYSDAHPVAFESADDDEPSGAGKAWLYVEPDGDVLSAQGYIDQLRGNLLQDPWEKIYPSPN